MVVLYYKSIKLYYREQCWDLHKKHLVENLGSKEVIKHVFKIWISQDISTSMVVAICPFPIPHTNYRKVKAFRNRSKYG
jgi:hypothetical protein